MNTHEMFSEAELEEPHAGPLVYELPKFLCKYPDIPDVDRATESIGSSLHSHLSDRTDSLFTRFVGNL